jgi:hypothetical protein
MSSILDEQLRFMALEQNGLMKSILTLGISERDLTLMVDCKINPNAVRTKKDQLPLKWCLPQTHLLGADLLSSITYSERIKIETFCERLWCKVCLATSF